MKKFLVKASLFYIYFVAFFIVINVLYAGLLVLTDFNVKKRLEELSFENPDFELLVLGASMASDGIDTKYLSLHGIRSYNLAIDGSNYKTNYIQLKEYLESYAVKPDYVILGIRSNDIKKYDGENIHPIVEVTMPEHKFELYDVPIFKFKWLGFNLFKKIISKKHREIKIVSGQIKFRKINPDNTEYSDSSFFDARLINYSHWIGEIAGLCSQNGIKFIIINMPGYKETRNNSSEGPYRVNFDNGYSAELYNLNSKDFCKIFNDSEDWIGNSHLNEFGATKFTDKLLSIFKQYEQMGDSLKKNN